VFKIDRVGDPTTLHSFGGEDGSNPYARLLEAADGYFYGTTGNGGAGTCMYGCGTVFRIDSSGRLTTLHRFAGAPNDGANPRGGLIQASDGNFYGTTSAGGSAGGGTIFRIDASGNLTLLHSFAGDEGSTPVAGLLQATDGNFYGTTSAGGAAGNGTIFRIDASGKLTTLHSFAGDEGSAPVADLIQATDGDLYGTASQDSGGSCCGSVFKSDLSGKVTTLYRFSLGSAYPVAGLIQATDGNFYGTTSFDGVPHHTLEDGGTVFNMDSSGKVITVHDFEGSGISELYGGVIEARDGSLYGTANGGGPGFGGVIFRLSSPLPILAPPKPPLPRTVPFRPASSASRTIGAQQGPD